MQTTMAGVGVVGVVLELAELAQLTACARMTRAGRAQASNPNCDHELLCPPPTLSQFLMKHIRRDYATPIRKGAITLQPQFA